MGAFKDIAGQRFGRLVALKPMRDLYRQRFLWECLCDCGGIKLALSDRLKSGAVQSCGCLKKEAAKRAAKHSVSHGMTGSYVHNVWMGMMRRCEYPSSVGWDDYGGRGIKVCERWRSSFEDFLADMGLPPTEKHQIDRYPDGNGDYEPGNCRWATVKENSRNRRSNRMITFSGEMLCITDWADRLGIKPQTLQRRIDILNWPLERAMTTGKSR